MGTAEFGVTPFSDLTGAIITQDSVVLEKGRAFSGPGCTMPAFALQSFELTGLPYGQYPAAGWTPAQNLDSHLGFPLAPLLRGYGGRECGWLEGTR